MIRLRGTIIYKNRKTYNFILTGKGRHTRYSDNIGEYQAAVLDYAVSLGYMTKGNDAPRGGKLGIHYKAIKTFGFNKLDKKYQMYKKRQYIINAL